ncbi:iron-containing alcohol dehydrogenase [Xanthobacter sp. ZOL 2024]
MAGFVFNTPPRIVVAAGAAGQVAGRWRAAGVGRVLVVTDGGVARAGALAAVLEALRAESIAHQVFQAVTPNPDAQLAVAAAAQAVDMRAEGVLGLGGGSCLDVAKLAALLATGHDALSEIYGVGLAEGPRLPLMLVPTLAGSGAEVTPIALVTSDGEKRAVVSSCLLADAALLDVDLTFTAPPEATAAAGAGCLAVAMEAFTSAHANANPVSRALAEGALALLRWALPLVVMDGADRRAREAMLSASLMAGQAFANAPAGAAHALAYPLCVRHGLPAGLAAALMLPQVVRFNGPVAAHDYGLLAARLFPERPMVGDAQARADIFAANLVRFFHELGLPTDLRAVGVEAVDVAPLAAAAMGQGRLLANNPRPLVAQDAAALYKAALD